MPVQNVSSINMQGQKKGSLFGAKNTGYVAVAGLALATATSFSKNKTVHKSHKTFAVIALAAMLAHIFKVTSRE